MTSTPRRAQLVGHPHLVTGRKPAARRSRSVRGMGHFLSNERGTRRAQQGLVTPWQLARRFARSWATNELQQLRQGWTRTASVMALVTVDLVILVAVGYLLGAPRVGILSMLVAVVVLCPLAALLALTGWEAINYRHALRGWFTDTPAGRGGAYITDRNGTWWLYCMHATPTGRGLGTSLMTQVCAAADAAGATVVLDSSGEAATRFYQRHGFTPAPGGRRRMRRTPKCQNTPLP